MGNTQSGVKISNAEYRQRDGISSSDLKKIAKSPAHFRYWKDHPEDNDTPALVMGRACHKYMLEKDDFFTEFAVAPNVDRRTKDGKQQWEEFLLSSSGKDVISGDDFEVIKEMHKVLYGTPFVAKLLSGEKETSFFMTDEETGMEVKCRPDCRTEIGGQWICIDYKNTENADSEEFMKQAIKLMYDLQASYYKDQLDKITGEEHLFVFIAQEKKPPYAVNVLQANDYFLKSGRDMYRTYLNLMAECEKTGEWYGYMRDEINVLGLPNWLQKQYEV